MRERDCKAMVEDVLTKKQELIRDYQMRAHEVEDPAVHRMLSHFAEAEAKMASKMKEELATL